MSPPSASAHQHAVVVAPAAEWTPEKWHFTGACSPRASWSASRTSSPCSSPSAVGDDRLVAWPPHQGCGLGREMLVHLGLRVRVARRARGAELCLLRQRRVARDISRSATSPTARPSSCAGGPRSTCQPAADEGSLGRAGHPDVRVEGLDACTEFFGVRSTDGPGLLLSTWLTRHAHVARRAVEVVAVPRAVAPRRAPPGRSRSSGSARPPVGLCIVFTWQSLGLCCMDGPLSGRGLSGGWPASPGWCRGPLVGAAPQRHRPVASARHTSVEGYSGAASSAAWWRPGAARRRAQRVGGSSTRRRCTGRARAGRPMSESLSPGDEQLQLGLLSCHGVPPFVCRVRLSRPPFGLRKGRVGLRLYCWKE